ncbi:MFS transporter [Hufsiella ginkgonis]|uniref:MFS transporter n=1 Tax=Hufsiella ginkgonis TaxID=2695274 RepID=A0A7K1Y0G2_9SPHI|nr:MFS transporter [Hufsiella ginkgonis]MXV16206.1 MFS transporter [Hufsiella ginkgonis]
MITQVIHSYKQAYTGLSRSNWYLALVMLINRSGTMVVPFMTIYCTRQLNFSIEQAGTIMALFGCGSIIGAYGGGKITDRFGFYNMQLVALFTGGLLFICTGYLKTFTPLCVAVFVLSMCNESFRPANSSATAYYSTDDNRTRSFSLNRLAINLGWAFGGAAGGFLASFNYQLLFWVDGCTNILAGLLLLKLLPAVTVAPARHNAAVAVRQSPYRDGVFLFFIGITILYAACFFQMFTIQPVFFKTAWLMSERFIGILMAFNGILIVSVEMVIIHQLEKQKRPLFHVALGVLLTGAAFALFNLLPASGISALLVIATITLGEILALPFMNTYWLLRTTTDNRGEYAGLYTIAWSVAQILSPVFGSRLISNYGFNALWWVSAGVCVFTAAGYFSVYLWEKRPLTEN